MHIFYPLSNTINYIIVLHPYSSHIRMLVKYDSSGYYIITIYSYVHCSAYKHTYNILPIIAMYVYSKSKVQLTDFDPFLLPETRTFIGTTLPFVGNGPDEGDEHPTTDRPRESLKSVPVG